MKTFQLLLALLFLFFISHVISSTCEVDECGEIFAEIVLKKLKVWEQAPESGYEPYTSLAIVGKILRNDLGGAAFLAARERDNVALTVLCSYLVSRPFSLERDDVNQQDENGNTLLHFAAEMGLVDVVRMLLPKAKDPNKENQNGSSPIMAAIRARHLDVAMMLLPWVRDVNQCDCSGQTLLHLAAPLPRLELVRGLLDRNCDVNKQDINGKTPIMLAEQSGYHGVADMMRVRLRSCQLK